MLSPKGMGRDMIDVQYEAPDERLGGIDIVILPADLFEGDNFSELERADRAQFRFQLEGSGEYHFATGTIAPTYPVTVIGPTTAPVTAKAQCSLSIFGWGMNSAGWAALMGNDASDYFDCAFDARRIFGDWIMQVRDELIAAGDFADQIELGCIAAEDIFRFKSSAPFEFTNKVDSWLGSGQRPRCRVTPGEGNGPVATPAGAHDQAPLRDAAQETGAQISRAAGCAVIGAW